MTLRKRAAVTTERSRLCPVAAKLDKKKPAGKSGLKTIFLEENSGDGQIMLRRHIFV